MNCLLYGRKANIESLFHELFPAESKHMEKYTYKEMRTGIFNFFLELDGRIILKFTRHNCFICVKMNKFYVSTKEIPLKSMVLSFLDRFVSVGDETYILTSDNI